MPPTFKSRPDYLRQLKYSHRDLQISLKSVMVLFWTVHRRESIVLIQIFFCDQMMFWSFEFFGRDWLLLSILILKSMKSTVFINIFNSNQYRSKNSKLQNIIWSQKKIWIKTIDSRQRTAKTIDFIDLHVIIGSSNQCRPKNSKVQNIIWSQKKIWIKNIVSRQQTVLQKLITILWAKRSFFWEKMTIGSGSRLVL